jgi:hypothetical protein
MIAPFNSIKRWSGKRGVHHPVVVRGEGEFGFDIHPKNILRHPKQASQKIKSKTKRKLSSFVSWQKLPSKDDPL